MEQVNMERTVGGFVISRRGSAPKGQYIIVNVRAISDIEVVGISRLRMREIMITAGIELMAQFSGVYTHLHNNQISVLLPKTTDIYGRKIDILLCRATSLVSAVVAMGLQALKCDGIIAYEADVYSLPSIEFVVDYFRLTQPSKLRHSMYTRAHELLCETRSDDEASRYLNEHTVATIVDKVLGGEVPSTWELNGTGLYREEVTRPVNPKYHDVSTSEPVTKWPITANNNLPEREDYAKAIINLVTNYERRTADKDRKAKERIAAKRAKVLAAPKPLPITKKDLRYTAREAAFNAMRDYERASHEIRGETPRTAQEWGAIRHRMDEYDQTRLEERFRFSDFTRTPSAPVNLSDTVTSRTPHKAMSAGFTGEP